MSRRYIYKGTFSKDTIKKGKLREKGKLRQEEEFAREVYERVIVRDRRSRLENEEEGNCNVLDVSFLI